MKTSVEENKLPKNRIIRDNLHGYIALTKIERAFLAQPTFQRLHFITQNGLAFQTYPSMRHSRFLHSLGAMHLAGRMLVSALRKPTPGRDSFRRAFDAYLEKPEYWKAPKDTKDVLASDRVYRDLGIDQDWKLCVMFQAVRLATLIHDIGHPPFSHSVEQALAQAVVVAPSDASAPRAESSGRTKRRPPTLLEGLTKVAYDSAGDHGLHEKIGQYLLQNVMLKELGDLADVSGSLVALAVKISSEYEDEAVLSALKGIIDGQFDCDRADYVLRDCAAAGVDFGGYDLERIVPEMVVIECEGEWFFRPALRALPALESFYEERSRLYRWIVFHTSCVRSHVAIQRATLWAIRLNEKSLPFTPRYTEDEADGLHSHVESIYRLWDFQNYSTCDESWYFSFLASLLSAIEQYLKEDETDTPSRALANLQGFIKQARWRNTTMLPVWKRIDQYRDFCLGVAEVARNQQNDNELVPIINDWLKDRLLDQPFAALEWIESELEKELGFSTAIHYLKFKYIGSDGPRANTQGLGVMLIDETVEDCDNGLRPIAAYSPIPDALEVTWKNSILFHAYGLKWGNKAVQDAEDLPTPKEFGRSLARILSTKDYEEKWLYKPEAGQTDKPL